MLSGISGSLLPPSFLAEVLPGHCREAFESRDATRAAARLARWWQRVSRALGPASSARAIVDVAVIPLLEALGYEVLHLERHGAGFAGLAGRDGRALAALVVAPWNAATGDAWRDLVRAGRSGQSRWGVVCTGRALRVIDAARSWSRRALEIEFERALVDEASARTFWVLVRAQALEAGAAVGANTLAGLIQAADRHTVTVCTSLGDGVLAALGGLVAALTPRARTPLEGFEQALTIVYRVLFLLFAEARHAVPIWHHLYREAYTIEALSRRSTHGLPPTGLWDALQAISRLAHAGCHAGNLRVTPFNGRLFSPRHAPLVERARVPDEVVRRTVLALATEATPGGRRPIAYADLGVEQLGAVYERVLEYEPARGTAPPAAGSRTPRDRRVTVLTRTSHERKSTGSFYTPRAITDFLVRRTLHPLVAGRTAQEILSLRVVDPAMGSGAFLVTACRYLAAAAERALVAAGTWPERGASREERASLRRTVAQRCLYGVDLNPMAVQLARLSLWLTTMAADRPLTFLDHRLAVGDSLVGTRLRDLAIGPPAGRRRTPRPGVLPLFEESASERFAADVLPARFRLADEPGDTVEAVRHKERTLAALAAADTPLGRWKAAADLWCAGWFWPDRGLPPALYGELLAATLGQPGALPSGQLVALLSQASRLARERSAFHWELEFPEIFLDAGGRPSPGGGFDAILGNPPWDALRADTGDAASRTASRRDRDARLRFFRTSGLYPCQGEGHANRYQLFLERALQLARIGGRIGLILPSGLATDCGSDHLRRALLETVDVERLLGFHNREGIFPIHRDVRFLLLTGTTGGSTRRLSCRFGATSAAWLDALPDSAADDPPDARPIVLSRALLQSWDPAHLAIPELTGAVDLAIFAQVTALPTLADPRGWGARFGRELNATDDRTHFIACAGTRPPRMLPIIEGKHLEPFRMRHSRATHGVARATAARLLDAPGTFERERLAYRDVASATNRLTLIAAILPRDTVSTHTLFCLKTPLGRAKQHCLLALLNSLVANYLVRLQVTTHVTVALMARLPVPRPPRGSPTFRELAALARLLARTGIEAHPDAYARLNALVAHQYALSREQYAHIVNTFPLLPEDLRSRCLAAYGQTLDSCKAFNELQSSSQSRCIRPTEKPRRHRDTE